MTIPRSAVQEAAFWHQDICLSCGDRTDSEEPPSLRLQVCDECGEQTVFHAPAFESALNMVIPLEGDEDD